MKDVRRLPGSLFSLLSAVGIILLFAATAVPASADSDDWSRVSAPPPPGPYRAVNLDPRIPGSVGIPTGVEAPAYSQQVTSQMDTPVMPGAAPAAGQPVTTRVPMNRLPPQVPGSYRSRLPSAPANAYAGPAHFSAPVGRRHYGTMMPPRGYFPGQFYPTEPVVPPPPVYDAMRQSSPDGRRRQ